MGLFIHLIDVLSFIDPFSFLLRTYDEYSSELISGHLSWTPVHESVDFWKENAAKLNDKDYEQLKCVVPSRCLIVNWITWCVVSLRTLIKLLNEASDPLVLAVAVHDVGQYVKHYERGKK